MNNQIDNELENIISELIKQNAKGLKENSLMNYVMTNMTVSAQLRSLITHLSEMTEK